VTCHARNCKGIEALHAVYFQPLLLQVSRLKAALQSAEEANKQLQHELTTANSNIDDLSNSNSNSRSRVTSLYDTHSSSVLADDSMGLFENSAGLSEKVSLCTNALHIVPINKVFSIFNCITVLSGIVVLDSESQQQRQLRNHLQAALSVATVAAVAALHRRPCIQLCETAKGITHTVSV
jgi:hypothetical protein